MNFADMEKKASPTPIGMDNWMMLVAKDGTYLAKVDASEDPWREDTALLIHCRNRFAEALRLLERVADSRLEDKALEKDIVKFLPKAMDVTI